MDTETVSNTETITITIPNDTSQLWEEALSVGNYSTASNYYYTYTPSTAENWATSSGTQYIRVDNLPWGDVDTYDYMDKNAYTYTRRPVDSIFRTNLYTEREVVNTPDDVEEEPDEDAIESFINEFLIGKEEGDV